MAEKTRPVVTTNDIGASIHDALDLLGEIVADAFGPVSLPFSANSDDLSNLKIVVQTPEGLFAFRVSIFREG